MYSIFTEIFESQFTRKCKTNQFKNIFIFPRIKSLNNNNRKQSSFLILMLYTVQSWHLICSAFFRAKNLNCQRRRWRELSIDIVWKATLKIHLVCAIIRL